MENSVNNCIVKFISSKCVDKKRVMKSKNNTIYENYEFIKEVAGEYLKSLFSIYQIGLATSMKGSDFIFDSVQLLHHQGHKMNVKYDRSYIDSPD